MITLFIIIGIVYIYLIIRCKIVFDYRSRQLDSLFERDDYKKCLEEFDTISPEQMVLSVKPVRNYYREYEWRVD